MNTMKLFKFSSTLLFLLFSCATFAQVQVTGTIVDTQNISVVGASILLKDKANTFGKLTDSS